VGIAHTLLHAEPTPIGRPTGQRTLTNIGQAVAAILAKREEVPTHRSVLIGITGIDGCGKG
jgi:hypothetical protein